ncbi:transposase [Acidocella sp. MX-AZ03]|uniref:IS66-like element accessory protein TnpA n=1 Tax=Acidocella sp. MX-AZ03 TaxID=2697363 RepID=UPI000A03D992|nr:MULTISPECIES: transposase [unclassified Acidocella]WBO57765.1 transposase [Acidocella sp. MX-AZ03]WBO58499.1 transposase [Acidocella sp. MX-AZ03]WBO58990.1 transposase [Acidocella sp. MX-AZ03]WBO60421.1 transposase [Acidocella sp. MX-AZ03]WBO61031.1 transposase [Acidocella sp. MX-AZ03]
MDNDGPKARHQHSHEDNGYHRVELITGRRRRRDWTREEKAEILAASAAPGAVVTQVARRYGVSRGLLWTWRRQAMNDLAMAGDFVPLRIVDDVAGCPMAEPAGPPSARDQAVGSIEIEIGRTRIRVEGAVDQAVLRQVLGLIGPAR